MIALRHSWVKVVHEVLEWIYKEKMSYLIWDSIEKKYTEIWEKNGTKIFT